MSDRKQRLPEVGAKPDAKTEALRAAMGGNEQAQPAQAVPLLTDQEIDSVWDAVPQNQFWWRRYARAVEQAVRAKLLGKAGT